MQLKDTVDMTPSLPISVVMATYNGEQFICEQLESITNQTFLPQEIIIADDSSTDRTLTIARRFAERAMIPVTIIVNPSRLGYGENFLTAVKQANGKYIAFCDQDDIWLPDKLKLAFENLESSNCHLYVHAAKVINSTGEEVDRFRQGIRGKHIVEPLRLPPWGVFYGFSMVFNSEVLSALDCNDRGGHTFEFHGRLSHDLWVYFISTCLGRTFIDDTPLVLYRRHGHNETPDLKRRGLGRMSQYFGVRAHPELRRDLIAADRSRVLAAFAASPTTHSLKRGAAAASRYWQRISRFEAIRIEIYSQHKLMRRALSCIRLVAIGGYRSYLHGGLGWHQSIKDVLLGVFQMKRKSK